MSHEATPLPLERLLSEARWLEALARRLTRDPARADDLVQSVWQTALERAPSELHEPRGWLARVLRNAWRQERREQDARRARERDSAPARSPDGAAEVVARAEAQRRLVEAVLALDEPYRSTVLWHYFDGLACEEIARRGNLSASTVRNRLARAHELLRARFERAGERGALQALVFSKAGVATGGLLMGLAVKGTLVFVAAAALGWWLWPGGRLEDQAAELGAPPAAITPPGLIGEAREDPREALAAAPAASPAPEPAHAAQPAAPPAPAEVLPAGVLTGIVLEDGAPCTRGGRIELLPEWYDEFPREPDVTRLRTAPLQADGTFRFESLEPRDYMLRALLPTDLSILASVPKLDPEHGRHVVLHFGSASLSGHVWDEDGQPRRNALVSVSIEQGQTETLSALHPTRTDDQGHYALTHLAAGYARGAVCTDRDATGARFEQHFSLNVEGGRAHTLDFGLPHPWPTWSGTLRNRSGAPVLGEAVLWLAQAGDEGSWLSVPIDAEGHFRTRLVPGTYGVRMRRSLSWDAVFELGQVVIGEGDLEHDLTVPGTRFSGRVVREDGGSLSEVPGRGRMLSLHQEGHNYPAAFRNAQIAADGSFVIDGLEPGTWLVNCGPRGNEPLRLLVREEDEELVRELRVKAP